MKPNGVTSDVKGQSTIRESEGRGYPGTNNTTARDTFKSGTNNIQEHLHSGAVKSGKAQGHTMPSN